jgi:hypothetical protein
MKTLTTSTGTTYRVSFNKSKRTITILTSSSKYRSTPMTKEEFNNVSYMTGNDFANWMKEDNYYPVR